MNLPNFRMGVFGVYTTTVGGPLRESSSNDQHGSSPRSVRALRQERDFARKLANPETTIRKLQELRCGKFTVEWNKGADSVVVRKGTNSVTLGGVWGIREGRPENIEKVLVMPGKDTTLIIITKKVDSKRSGVMYTYDLSGEMPIRSGEPQRLADVHDRIGFFVKEQQKEERKTVASERRRGGGGNVVYGEPLG